MGVVILRGHPTPFRGALTLPSSRRLERMVMIERLLQSAISAIWEVVSEGVTLDHVVNELEL